MTMFEQVAGELAAHSMETAAPHVATQLRERADALNLPRVGCHQNAYCPAVQLNISPAQEDDPEQARKCSLFTGKQQDAHHHDACSGEL